MTSQPKIVLVKTGGAYKVKQTVGTLVHEPGDILQKRDVEDLISGRCYTIVTQEK
jgi:hypothetical protein